MRVQRTWELWALVWPYATHYEGYIDGTTCHDKFNYPAAIRFCWWRPHQRNHSESSQSRLRNVLGWTWKKNWRIRICLFFIAGELVIRLWLFAKFWTQWLRLGIKNKFGHLDNFKRCAKNVARTLPPPNRLERLKRLDLQMFIESSQFVSLGLYQNCPPDWTAIDATSCTFLVPHWCTLYLLDTLYLRQSPRLYNYQWGGVPISICL